MGNREIACGCNDNFVVAASDSPDETAATARQLGRRPVRCFCEPVIHVSKQWESETLNKSQSDLTGSCKEHDMQVTLLLAFFSVNSHSHPVRSVLNPEIHRCCCGERIDSDFDECPAVHTNMSSWLTPKSYSGHHTANTSGGRHSTVTSVLSVGWLNSSLEAWSMMRGPSLSFAPYRTSPAMG